MVIRSADVIVNPAFAIHGIPDKDPIDRAWMMSRRGRALGQSHCMVKARVAEKRFARSKGGNRAGWRFSALGTKADRRP